MLSVPPVNTTSASPNLISCNNNYNNYDTKTMLLLFELLLFQEYSRTCAALMMDWNPEPQSLLTVIAEDFTGTPASKPT